MIIPMLCVTIFVILVVWFLLPRVARLIIHTPTAISIFVCLSMVQDRKSVVYGESVDLGGRRIIKKKRPRCRQSSDRLQVSRMPPAVVPVGRAPRRCDLRSYRTSAR